MKHLSLNDLIIHTIDSDDMYMTVAQLEEALSLLHEDCTAFFIDSRKYNHVYVCGMKHAGRYETFEVIFACRGLENHPMLQKYTLVFNKRTGSVDSDHEVKFYDDKGSTALDTSQYDYQHYMVGYVELIKGFYNKTW